MYLLKSIGGQALALRWVKLMLLEVYKCIKKMSAPCLIYPIQMQYLINSERQSLNSHCAEHRGMGWEHFTMSDPIYGINVLNDYDDAAHIDFNEFKAFLNTWKGPDIFQYAIPLLWWYTMLWVVFLLVSVVYWISLLIFCCTFTCIFTRGQFRPLGIVIGCVCGSVCPGVCVCINHEFVRTMITHRSFKLGSPNLDQRCKTHWFRSLLFFGLIDLDLQGQI